MDPAQAQKIVERLEAAQAARAKQLGDTEQWRAVLTAFEPGQTEACFEYALPVVGATADEAKENALAAARAAEIFSPDLEIKAEVTPLVAA